MIKSELSSSDNDLIEFDYSSLFNAIFSIKKFIKSNLIILLIGLLLGGVLGISYSVFKQPKYTASLSFALEEEKSSSGGGGLAGALGLASSLGLDLGTGGGGAFSGANLLELIKSRTILEKTLANKIIINNKNLSLGNYFIQIYELDKKWVNDSRFNNFQFENITNNNKFVHDSIVNELQEIFSGPNAILSVGQKDKKVSIINIELKSKNELFSKYFVESIAKEISEYYIVTKSKKARINVSILQKQVDSIRSELFSAISGVAVANDNVYNLNPALNRNRIVSAKKQVDVQANTAILTQLVTNLEMAKVTLLKETPLIQVIDYPILPLKKDEISKVKGGVFGAILGVMLFFILTIYIKFYDKIKRGILN